VDILHAGGVYAVGGLVVLESGGSPGGGSGVCEGPLGLECPGGPALPAEWLADLLGAEVFVG